jgi:FkbM family methyltransferase
MQSHETSSSVLKPINQRYTSFSANFEDVILHRIFGLKAHGFYVDVGAAHPLFENDTKLFYDRGWNGINIEPNTVFFDQLKAERPRDHNVCAAISKSAESISFHEVVGTGLSTCDPSQAQVAHSKGYQVRRYDVPTARLSTILNEVAPTHIDFLKIDVEGLEQEVLATNDWKQYRPSVILLEATFPESPVRRQTEIRQFLEGHGYHWRYFDGLNDFYVASEFEVADDIFTRPPNIFDGFRLREAVDSEQHVKNLEVRVESIEIELQNTKFERHRLAVATEAMRNELIELHSELEKWIQERQELVQLRAIRTSTSWIITRPLRRIGDRLKRSSTLRKALSFSKRVARRLTSS